MLMKKINLWDIEFEKDINYYDINELINYIKENKIKLFYVVDECAFDEEKKLPDIVKLLTNIGKKDNIQLIFFDKNHKSFVEKFFGNIFIEKEYFNKNKEIIVNEVYNNIKEDFKHVYIDKNIYSEEFVREIILKVEDIVFDEGIVLSDDIIDLIKKNKVDASIKKDGALAQIL